MSGRTRDQENLARDARTSSPRRTNTSQKSQKSNKPDTSTSSKKQRSEEKTQKIVNMDDSTASKNMENAETVAAIFKRNAEKANKWNKVLNEKNDRKVESADEWEDIDEVNKAQHRKRQGQKRPKNKARRFVPRPRLVRKTSNKRCLSRMFILNFLLMCSNIAFVTLWLTPRVVDSGPEIFNMYAITGDIPPSSEISKTKHEKYYIDPFKRSIKNPIDYMIGDKRGSENWISVNNKATGRKRRDLQGTMNVTTRREKPTSKIVGGVFENIKRTPYFVSIWEVSDGEPESHTCGGSILNKEWILSAAHCFYEDIPEKFIIFAGVSTHEESTDFIGIDGHKVHKSRVLSILYPPCWDEETFECDLALLMMVTPIDKWTDYIQPTLIPYSEAQNKTQPIDGMQVMLVGMGLVKYASDNEEPSDYLPLGLKRAYMRITERSACERLLNMAGYKENITADKLCAGNYEGIIDGCTGDSGGPLNLPGFLGQDLDIVYWQVGVVSYGFDCSLPEIAGVYADVTYFADWISDSINHFMKNFVKKP